jgi:uncharacterized membrane protein YphA (DoxX/SURF4 family)
VTISAQLREEWLGRDVPSELGAPLNQGLQHDMTWLSDAFRKADEHTEVVLDLVRIYLGIGLFVRGILFVTEAEGIETLVDPAEFSLLSAAVVHYVSFVHLLGGLMLAVGLLTRLSALLQIPILTGAVFLVHWQEGLLSADQSLEFSALVLFLLVVVFLWGPGRWSADNYVFAREPEGQDDREFETWWRTEEEERREPAPAGAERSPLAATETDAREGSPKAEEGTQCACGYDLTHPRITVEPRYTWYAGFFFMLGISAPVNEVTFYCEECGTVMKRTSDPEVCRKYQWHTS